MKNTILITLMLASVSSFAQGTGTLEDLKFRIELVSNNNKINTDTTFKYMLVDGIAQDIKWTFMEKFEEKSMTRYEVMLLLDKATKSVLINHLQLKPRTKEEVYKQYHIR